MPRRRSCRGRRNFDKQSSVTRNEIREAEKRLDKPRRSALSELETLGIKERNIERAIAWRPRAAGGDRKEE